jgi:hypothetical protein
MHIIDQAPVRELSHRHGDGIDVTLFWNPQTNEVFVAVVDERLGEAFELGVPASDALDAFRHPYAYAERAYLEDAIAA